MKPFRGLRSTPCQGGSVLTAQRCHHEEHERVTPYPIGDRFPSVNLEVRHRVSRIATMRNRAGEQETNVFGGVIFTLASRRDIAMLKNLKGRSLMAVDRISLGGFQMAWGELAEHGIDPYRDLSDLRFGGIHDEVVNAVTRGDVDAGTVRTDILERMAAAGLIDPTRYRILNPRQDADFPVLHSTPLYPEWPFSKLRHTPNRLAQQVAIALFNMPSDHPAARVGAYAGWTIPLDYQLVHGLLKRLHLPPYDKAAPFTLADAIKRYWLSLLLGSVALLITPRCRLSPPCSSSTTTGRSATPSAC